MKEFFVYLYLALLGGFGYCTIEIIYRGRTHYSMFFAGAIVLASFYYISKFTNMSLIQKCIVGALIITMIEFALGIWFNLILHENVWDYSNVPFNLMGQICLPFSAIWLAFSFIIFRIMERVKV